MSIIYNALQKTQENRAQENLTKENLESKRNTSDVVSHLIFSARFKKISVLVLAFLFSLFILTQYVILKKRLPHASDAKSSASLVKTDKTTKPINQPYRELELNGVFVSNQNKIAMINNQAFGLNDTVDGMKIIAIDLHSVKLKNEKGVIVLHSAI